MEQSWVNFLFWWKTRNFKKLVGLRNLKRKARAEAGFDNWYDDGKMGSYGQILVPEK